MKDNKIKLLLKDEKEYMIKREIAQRSGLLKGLMNDYEDYNEFELRTIDYSTMEKIGLFLLYESVQNLSRVPNPLKYDEGLDGFLSNFEKDYMKEYNLETAHKLKDFITIVSWFDISSLFELLCAKLADISREMCKEDFSLIFNNNK